MKIRAVFTLQTDNDYPDIFEDEEHLREVFVENITDIFLGMDFYNVKVRSLSIDKEE
jgi:hypothetical protein